MLDSDWLILSKILWLDWMTFLILAEYVVKYVAEYVAESRSDVVNS